MNKPLKPTRASDIEALLAHREKLVGLRGKFLDDWGGGNRLPDGAIAMPYPIYPEAVVEFFRAAGREPWSDYNYTRVDAGAMVRGRAPYAHA